MLRFIAAAACWDLAEAARMQDALSLTPCNFAACSRTADRLATACQKLSILSGVK